MEIAIAANLYIQGDVCLEKIAAMPKSAQPHTNDPLAFGEVSGHVHVILPAGCSYGQDVLNATRPETKADAFGHYFDPVENTRYLHVVGGDGAMLAHVQRRTGAKADHESISLPPGVYRIRLQEEYNPEADAMQVVID